MGKHVVTNTITRATHPESLYYTLLHGASDAMLVVDYDATVILEANAAAALLTGYSRDQLVLSSPRTLLPQVDVPIGVNSEFETMLRDRDGSEKRVVVAQSAVTYNNTVYLLLIIRESAQHVRSVQQQMQAEKLASMQRLTASIAHELNNPLQALHSSLHLLVERPMEEAKRVQILSMAHEQVGQLVNVVQHMMDLYRPAHTHMRLISPHELLEAALAGASERVQLQGITVVRDWDGELPRVRGVGSQLKQVLSSLIANALDAMPQGGTLLLRTRRAMLLDQPSVQIDVIDSGKGLRHEQLHNIFEPFYSTHAERTGLSLALAYSVVMQHGGKTTVEPHENGTTFTICLPAVVWAE